MRSGRSLEAVALGPNLDRPDCLPHHAMPIRTQTISRAQMADNLNEDERTYQRIALQLSQQINDGALAHGTLLPSERELAETFGASRTSIRQALLSLQSSGLIAVRPRARARVTRRGNTAFFNQLSGAARALLAEPQGVANFQEARMLFECGLARYAARHASQKEIDRLEMALAQNKRAIGNPPLFAKTDVAFHDILAEIPRNPIFTALDAALSEWLMNQRQVGMPIRGAIRNAYEGHAKIFAAIANHDVEGADEAMADHLRTVMKFYWRAVGKTD